MKRDNSFEVFSECFQIFTQREFLGGLVATKKIDLVKKIQWFVLTGLRTTIGSVVAVPAPLT